MNTFTNFLLHFIFISVFLVLIIVSVMLLKPLRVHQKRPVSTMALKFSYLAYLVAFIGLAFTILFYGDIPEDVESLGEDMIITLSYIVIILSFFVPNLAIMLRRKVKKLRQIYNIFFTIVNLMFVIAIVVVFFYFPFTFN